MPRTSLRQKILRGLKKVLHERHRAMETRATWINYVSSSSSNVSSSSSMAWFDDTGSIFSDSTSQSERSSTSSSRSSNNTSVSDYKYQDHITNVIQDKIMEIENTRYLNGRGQYRKRQYYDWDDALSDESVRYNEEEFLRTFRVRRESFHIIVNLIRRHKNFKSVNGKRRKATVEKHLLVFLYRVGCLGDSGGDEAVADYFGLGKGSVKEYCRRVVGALISLKDEYLTWPDEIERNNIKKRIKLNYGFQNCIGIIDGTLIFLLHRPIHYGDSYYCRKNAYAINVQIICDDQKRIRYIYGGWPGSTHDNRAWRNCKVFRNFKKYFEEGEYLLSDSAYSTSAVVVPCFKKMAGELSLSLEQSFFNTEIGRIRVVSEHCIGILKNRFPCLKCLNLQIEGKESMKEAMDLLEALCILHNVLIGLNEEIPETWYEDIDNDHYWTEEDCPFVAHSFNANEVENADRRESVFIAYIENYYY